MRFLFLLTLSACFSQEPYPTKVVGKLTISWETDAAEPDWDQVSDAMARFETTFGVLPEAWEVEFKEELFVDLMGLTSTDNGYSEVAYHPVICKTAFLHEILHVWLYQTQGETPQAADPFHELPHWSDLNKLENECLSGN